MEESKGLIVTEILVQGNINKSAEVPLPVAQSRSGVEWDLSAKLFDRVFFRKGQSLFLEETVYSDLPRPER